MGERTIRVGKQNTQMVITRQERHYAESTLSRSGIELMINTVNSYEQVKRKKNQNKFETAFNTNKRNPRVSL